MRPYPILIVLHLLTIIFTSTLSSGEEQRVRGLMIRQRAPTNYEEEGREIQDDGDKRLIEIIKVKSES
jgi:hypothetical protein